MTYLYLFSEGNTVHTLILSGRTTPRSATSGSRTTQILPSPVTFRGAQDCTHEGEPLGLWLSSQCSRPCSPGGEPRGCCPAEPTRGRGGTAAGYASNHGMTSNSASKEKEIEGAWCHSRVLWADTTLAHSVLGRVRLTAKGWWQCGCLHLSTSPRLSLGCRSSPSEADAHAWPRGLHRVPGELHELRHRHLPRRHVPSGEREPSLLQSTEQVKPLLVVEQGGLLKRG